MKTLLSMIVLLTSLNSLAGSIINEATGETLEFTTNAKTRTIDIESNSAGVPSRTLKLQYLEASPDYVKTYGITRQACLGMFGDYGNCLLVPFINVPGLVIGAVETVMLPVKMPLNIIQKKRAKKDFQIFMSAIVKDEETTVSENRFRRIESLIIHNIWEQKKY